MKKVLVTALGTITATSIVQELKSSNESYYILGADINDATLIATSKDVNEFYKFPSSVERQGEFLEFVFDFCKKHQVEYIIPSIDEEVMIYSQNREKFKNNGVNLCIPNQKLINICHYKDKFNRWMALNMPECAIKTYDVCNEKIEYPVFIKPIEGRASNGCRIIYNQNELQRQEDLQKCIVQEVAHGAFITADVVQNYQYHQFACIQREELLRNKNGCGIAVKTVKNKHVEEICYEIAEKLNLNGVINIEFFVLDDRVQVVEINPRFSAGSYYSFLAGCNLAQESINIADNAKCQFGNIIIGKNYVRRYETYEI